METIIVQQPINLKVVPFEFDFTPPPDKPSKKPKEIIVPKIVFKKKPSIVPSPPIIKCNKQRTKNVKDLVEELLEELYSDKRNWSCTGTDYGHGSTSAASRTSSQSNYGDHGDFLEINYLEDLDIKDLRQLVHEWGSRLLVAGERLGRSVKTKDRLKRQQKRLCAAFSVLLRNITGDNSARFSLTPAEAGAGEAEGEGGYTEWLHAMRLVARLPAGVPQHFRRKLWLTLSERHLTSRGVDWPVAERACFRGTAQPDDTELGAQILKDLHRTGCSLFCGAEGRENQAMLRRVLLAYARWNKDVGYCQGFNMLAAIILEVMEKSESDSLKVMIYLVEAVLPEGYFADDLRGLSADMAAFRDLLKLRQPGLARHMDYLQKMSDGGGVEPPLPDVFTMQWFLTLYATWLPRDSLLKIWDLVLLDGNEILLLTALAIWDMLQDRILSARSADEYYSCMGGGAGAVYEAGDSLVARVVALGSAPELPRLRNLHRYRVAPPAPPIGPPNYHPPLHSAMRRGLRLFYSEDEGDSSDDGNKMALATVIPRREERLGAGDRLTLDIGALKRQYARLRERQRQAHVILAAACARHAAVGVPTSPTSLTVNNLLLGKSAIVSARGRRLCPPPGAVPPSRYTSRDKSAHAAKTRPETISWQDEQGRKTLSRRNSVKWKDIKKEKEIERARKASIDLDEMGDGVIVSETEANAMVASLRSRSSSETSSYSTRSESSSDTSLCDDNLKDSDSDSELPKDNEKESFNPKMPSTTISPLVTMSEAIDKMSEIALSEVYKSNSSLSSTELCSKDISQYIETDAGEPLRTYIGGFESKLNDITVPENSDDTARYLLISPIENVGEMMSDNKLYSDTINYKRDEVVQRIGKSTLDTIFKVTEHKKQYSLPKSSKNITDLSPIDLSPCNFSLETKSPQEFDIDLNYRQPISSRPEFSSRPPDIIDKFIRYPNFVPDIDLSDKNISDVDSPPRSPGQDSLVVSEDEPPIPLKIDKYFEHSPDFFGARITVTDQESSDFSSRRPPKRQTRVPKKPDSLTLQCNHNEKLDIKDETERASSLPHSYSDQVKKCLESAERENIQENNFNEKKENAVQPDYKSDSISPNILEKTEYDLHSGRKNSERALQIIQENSKILRRILTKQSIPDESKRTSPQISEIKTIRKQENRFSFIADKTYDEDYTDLNSPVHLKESSSDSQLGYKKRNAAVKEKVDFQKIRPISVDDPFCLEASNIRGKDFVLLKNAKSPSTESLLNKTDLYGWENKGFIAKSLYSKSQTPEHLTRIDLSDSKRDIVPDWRCSYSSASKTSVTLPSDIKESPNLDRPRMASTDYTFPLSNKYNDFVLSRASDICSRTVDQGPKVCENLPKTDSQVSEFAHVVTSSISFTYEQSAEDDSPIGAKSNSSDTLCQIASLDQVSTPISPKVFPRDTPTNPKEYTPRSEKFNFKLESDDTCSAITSLIETDTLSSLSYPRSPSTGSYHPFPTRPAIRLPKELGVRLGMYPKDNNSSPPK